MLTQDEAAIELGVPLIGIAQLIKSGSLPRVKVGHKILIRRGSLERFMRGEAPRVSAVATVESVDKSAVQLALMAVRSHRIPVETNIYFVEAGGVGLVKIGAAVLVERRLRELQTASPYQLQVLAVIPGSILLERELHSHLRASRYRREWFRLSPTIKEFLACLQK